MTSIRQNPTCWSRTLYPPNNWNFSALHSPSCQPQCQIFSADSYFLDTDLTFITILCAEGKLGSTRFYLYRKHLSDKLSDLLNKAKFVHLDWDRSRLLLHLQQNPWKCIFCLYILSGFIYPLVSLFWALSCFWLNSGYGIYMEHEKPRYSYTGDVIITVFRFLIMWLKVCLDFSLSQPLWDGSDAWIRCLHARVSWFLLEYSRYYI